MQPLNDALPGPYVPVWVTRGALAAHRYILMRRLAAEPRNTAGILFFSQCSSGTILLTPYSMVWDWLVSRAGPMLLIGLSCSIPIIVVYYFSLSLLSLYWLVLWGWGLWTDRVYITLSLSLALPTSFNNNNNTNNIVFIGSKNYTLNYLNKNFTNVIMTFDNDLNENLIVVC